MFRKKKYVGSVTVFEENDISAEDRFNDLNLGGDETDANGGDPLTHMTAEQLTKLAIANAHAGKQATQRALAIAEETREIGMKTGEELHKQTEQLEKLGDDFVVVHNYLDKSERVIEKMRKPKLMRMLQGKKNRYHYKKTHDTKEYEALREKGIESLNSNNSSRNKHLNVVSMDEICAGDDHDESFSSSSSLFSKTKLKWKKNKRNDGNVIIRDAKDVQDNYADFDPQVGDVLRDQDDDLDLISDSLSNMKHMAIAMNNELNYQSHLVLSVQDSTQQASERARRNVTSITKI